MSVLAAEYNLVIEQGVKFDKTFTVYEDDGVTLKDLSNYVGRMSIKEFISGTSAIDLTTENGRIKLGGALGTIQLRIPQGDTAALTFDIALYDLELENLYRRSVERVLKGVINLDKEITTISYGGTMATEVITIPITSGRASSGHDYVDDMVLPFDFILTEIHVFCKNDLTSVGRISVRDTAGGHGNGITATIDTGARHGTNTHTGVLFNAGDKIYVRVVTAAQMDDPFCIIFGTTS